MNCDHSRIKEACGVIGIYTSSEEQAANSIYYGFFLSLQHRGQESLRYCCVTLWWIGGNLNVHRGMDLSTKSLTTTSFILLPAIWALGMCAILQLEKLSLQNAHSLSFSIMLRVLLFCTMEISSTLKN